LINTNASARLARVHWQHSPVGEPEAHPLVEAAAFSNSICLRNA